MNVLNDNHLSPKNLADFILKLAEQINFHWNFYVVSNVAIIGWLLSLNNNPPLSLKILASVVIAIFFALNLTGLLRNYIFLQAALLEFKSIVNEVQFKTRDLPQRINNLSFDGYKCRLWLTHAVVNIGVIAVLWSDKLQDALRIADN